MTALLCRCACAIAIRGIILGMESGAGHLRGSTLCKAPRGPNGERLCRNCHGPLPTGARHNCSSACSEEWMIKTSPSHARYKVWERDRGVCAVCGKDAVADKFNRNGSPRTNRARGTGDLWQADHIKPVIEGGGECGLDNLRTLCTECHLKETAALRARMAERALAEKLAPLSRPLAIGDTEQIQALRYVKTSKTRSANAQQSDMFAELEKSGNA